VEKKLDRHGTTAITVSGTGASLRKGPDNLLATSAKSLALVIMGQGETKLSVFLLRIDDSYMYPWSSEGEAAAGGNYYLAWLEGVNFLILDLAFVPCIQEVYPLRGRTYSVIDSTTCLRKQSSSSLNLLTQPPS